MSKTLRPTWLTSTVCGSNKTEVAFSRKIANLAMTNGCITAINPEPQMLRHWIY
ncbi:hypothetical protein [Photobacterium kasasachensis]|uniref:hypothetical protein n=1 Tax=Photobacterium kasasachensis TaxID=2910240 RepID=UPI003D0E4B7D